jgi:AraC-like DNA-binding protein
MLDETETKSYKRRYTRLAPKQWAEVEALWQTGDVTLAELSERFGASERALQHHFKKAGITKGEKAAALAAAVKAEILESELSDEGLLRQRAKDIQERTYRNAVHIQGLIMAQLAVAEKDPTQALRVGSALKALSLASNALERLHGVQQRALGLDRDDVFPKELPTIVFENLTQKDLDAIAAEHAERFGIGLEVQAETPGTPTKGIVVLTDAEDDGVVEVGAELYDAEGVRLAKRSR